MTWPMLMITTLMTKIASSTYVVQGTCSLSDLSVISECSLECSLKCSLECSLKCSQRCFLGCSLASLSSVTFKCHCTVWCHSKTDRLLYTYLRRCSAHWQPLPTVPTDLEAPSKSATNLSLQSTTMYLYQMHLLRLISFKSSMFTQSN